MIGNGSLKFQPIWVEDVVTCLLKMTREPERYDGRTIDVGGSEVYTYAQILDLLMGALKKRKHQSSGADAVRGAGGGGDAAHSAESADHARGDGALRIPERHRH